MIVNDSDFNECMDKVINGEIPCWHPVSGLRIRRHKNGSEHWVMQCYTCGVAIKTVKKGDTDSEEYKLAAGTERSDCDSKYGLLYFEEGLNDRFIKSVNEARRQRYLIEKQMQINDYHEYLKSDKWRTIRNKILNRCKYICEGCLIREAVHVHHITYNNIGNELAFQLVGLCEECHETAHKKG